MAAKPPAPMPEGKTWEDLKYLPISQGEWREEKGFVCNACGSPAYLHPNSNHIWGCKVCGFTTASPSVYFKSSWFAWNGTKSTGVH